MSLRVAPARLRWPAAPSISGLIRTFAATLVVTAALVVIGVLTATVFRSDHATIMDHVGFDLDALQHGRFWIIPAATFVQTEVGIKWHQALLALLFLGILEYQAGGLRTLVAFALSDWISSPLTVLALWAAAALGSHGADQAIHAPSTGSSAAVFGAVVAAAVMMPRPLRELSLLGLVGFLAAAFGFQRIGVATPHVIAAAVGLLLGRWYRQAPLRQVVIPGLLRPAAAIPPASAGTPTRRDPPARDSGRR